MKKILLVVLLLALPFSSFSQKEITPEQIKSKNKPWTHLNLNNNNFQFAIVTDRTGGHRPGVFSKGIERINLIQPEFVISVGDLIEGYTKDKNQLIKEWKEFNGFIDQFDMPFFYVAGNHDYTNQTMAEMWRKRFGAEYYHFLYQDVLFLCLNSEDGATRLKDPDIGHKQMQYIEETLNKYSNVRWTMVFLHQPLWVEKNATNWLKVEEMLASRKHSVFTGHYHRYTLYERNRSDYFTLATMGGVSGLRGANYGELDHFMWVTMTDSGPYYANIALDGIHGKELYTESQLKKADIYDVSVPVRQLPVFLAEDKFEKVSYSVTNPDTVSREVRLTFRNGRFMKTLEKTLAYTLGPKECKQIDIPVTLSDDSPPLNSPLFTRAEFIGDDFIWHRNYKATPNQKLSIPKSKVNIEIDGDLGDWYLEDNDFIKGIIKGKSEIDGQAQYYVTRDKKYLYIAAQITDDEIINEFGVSPMEQDALLLSIDARPISESAYNIRDIEAFVRGEWLALIMSPNRDSFGLAYSEMLPKGILGLGRKTSQGYQVEYAIPFEVLNNYQGQAWQNFRLNISLMDIDTGDKNISITHWFPDWAGNHVGSGTFFRK